MLNAAFYEWDIQSCPVIPVWQKKKILKVLREEEKLLHYSSLPASVGGQTSISFALAF